MASMPPSIQSALANFANPDPNELVLIIDGVKITGWEDIEVTLHAEAFPNNFSVRASMQPGNQLPAEPGNTCTVMLGSDQVIVGYVDGVTDSVTPDGHSIEIHGRGKTQDLVDCGAEWPSGQITNSNALEIAQKLAEPYGITVNIAAGASPGLTVPQMLLNYGETGAAIIQRVARWAILLAYEDHLGQLLFAPVSTTVAASGVAYGSPHRRPRRTLDSWRARGWREGCANQLGL